MTKIYFIPAGTKNLSRLFPSIDWSTVDSYSLHAQDASASIIATTPRYQVDQCLERDIRIHFINSFNCIDAINFHIVTAEHDTKSDAFQAPESFPFDRTQYGIGRINISSTDSFSVYTIDYEEKDLSWMDELADSPIAWLEWTSEQGEGESYLPIVISDGKKVNRKQDERFQYEIDIDFQMSTPAKLIRL